MNTKVEKRHAVMLLGSMYVMQIAITGFMFGPIALFADPIVNDWGILRSQYSVVETMATLLNALISISIYGPLEKRFGMKKLMAIGGVLCCGGFAVLIFAHGLVLLYTGGAMFGMGAAFLSNNTINTVITRRFAMKQGLALGTIRVVGSFSSTVGAWFVGMWIYDQNIGYHGAFILITVIGLICFALWMLLYRGDPEDLGENPMYLDEFMAANADDQVVEEYSYGPTAAETWKDPRFYVLGLNYVFIGFVTYGLIGPFSLFCGDFGLAEHSGSAMSVLWLGAAILSFPAGLICDKWGTKTLITLCSTCIAIAAVIFRIGGVTLPVLYIASLLIGFGYTMNLVPVGISTREAFGTRDFARKTGMAVGCMILGASAAPIVMNVGYDFFGHTYSHAFLMVIVFCIIAAGLSWFSTRPVWKADEHRKA